MGLFPDLKLLVGLGLVIWRWNTVGAFYRWRDFCLALWEIRELGCRYSSLATELIWHDNIAVKVCSERVGKKLCVEEVYAVTFREVKDYPFSMW
jgi:hypothetical protein